MKRLATLLIAIMAISVISAASAMRLTAAMPPVALGADSSLAFREHGVRLTVSPLSQTFTRKITARWGVATNALGDATSYRVRWRVLSNALGNWRQTERVVTTLSDTLTVDVPLAPDSALVQISVWARRRGMESTDSVYAWRSFNRADAPPPPPGPVVLDTVVALTLYSPKTQLITGDSVQTCLTYRSASGLTGLIMSIPTAPTGPFNPAQVVPEYTSCKTLVEQALGGPLTGTDYFGVGQTGVPPCVYPRGAAPPAACTAPKSTGQRRLPLYHVGV